METSLLLSLLPIGLLIFFSAFFSASETGLTASSRAKIHKLEMEGNKRAAMVHRLREDKDKLIGAVLLGNNVVNILASALATGLALKLFGDNGIAYATFGMTLLILIFGELMPKTYAFYNAEKVALWVAPVFTVLVKLFAPITLALQYVVHGALHMIGVARKGSEEVSPKDALRGAIALHTKEGAVQKQYRHMLDSILDLSEREVQEVMTHRKNMVTLNADLPFETLIQQAMKGAHTRIPLWQERRDNIIGVLHMKDLLRTLQKQGPNPKRKIDVVTLAKEAWFVPDTTSLSKQMSEFRKRRSHLALVVDEYGDLVGLVTLEDILEEIVGEIQDEYDAAETGIKKLKNGIYQIDGEVPVRDINRRLDWQLPESDASTTLAGLVIEQAGTIPRTGQEFVFGGFRFKISRKRRNQITRLIVSRETKGT